MAFRLTRRRMLGAVSALLLIYIGLMIVESRKPALPAVRPREDHPVGYVFVSMVVDLVQVQLEGAGGWTPNDLPLTPGYWLDNLPSFQLGVLSAVRRVSVSLRDDLGRARPGEPPPPELALAAESYAADPRSWSRPSAERMLLQGNEALVRFRADLGGRAHIDARPEQLQRLIDTFAQQLDAVDQRLLFSSDREVVPWYKVDDNLYYAQGVAFAQLGMLRAFRADFGAQLSSPQTQKALDAAIKSLADSQFEPWVVTNGSKSSLLANHSANLRTILEDARGALSDLSLALKA